MTKIVSSKPFEVSFKKDNRSKSGFLSKTEKALSSFTLISLWANLKMSKTKMRIGNRFELPALSPVVYFGLSASPKIFGEKDCIISKIGLDLDQVKYLVKRGVATAINPAHNFSIEMLRRLGIEVEIPYSKPFVRLEEGDAIVVMQPKNVGHRCLNGGFTSLDVQRAEPVFNLLTVQRNINKAEKEFFLRQPPF
ncbi:MAG: hypothetical protein WC397_00255 [Candidatus Paceibacterota bacterium]